MAANWKFALAMPEVAKGRLAPFNFLVYYQSRTPAFVSYETVAILWASDK
jgi:hypothetical protein